MEQHKRMILIPEYMKQFRCIGSECEDSCCIGWTVSLDKKRYQNYKRSNNMELKPIFKSMVRRSHNNKSDEFYGRIVMDELDRCPFLDESRLCKIQGILGEEHLSDICASYPRFTNRIDGKLERSATISCPEIARLALLNPKGISFEQIQEDKDLRIMINSRFDTEGHMFYNKPERYFWDIRLFCISLLQDRNYSISERLILLGIVNNRIEGLYKMYKTHDIPKTLESLAQMIDRGSFKDELNKVPSKIEIQLKILETMINERLLIGSLNGRYMECLNETLLGLENTEDEKIETTIKKYEETYTNYLKDYLEEKEYILENFLVNEYFRGMMPFGGFASIWDSYIFLCVIYGMIKLHLIGMAGYHKGLNDELTLKLIQSFSKVILHNNQYIQSIINLIKENGLDTLAYMTILSKN
ncbi:flagellin lysine-N-methylase [Tissierella sp.]|uniref:flagellin lysine-N-methylase n=1 Tax=Tissierella sp. TaxID=41274 RepID=UPI00286289A1|nr:flagellin lysine-N-methylase [Tissierella sp.]MDR7856908.1 flagellin lysine-N-methylase [Tissierella sp.]